MLAKILKAVLEWLSGLVKSEIKQDVKATDVETPKEIVDDFRSSMRRKLRDNESSIHKGEQ
tara:strand:+ start:288 stop:470 length:183 start_codon:yes stop_codon:yes gene_type:complete